MFSATRTFLIAFLALSPIARADEPIPKEPLQEPATIEKTTQPLDGPTYSLVYQFREGEVFRTKVTHLTTVETRVGKGSETARTRSESTKSWTIKSVVDQGPITLVHLVDDVEMWSSISDRAETKYNSKTDGFAPPGYESVAQSVGSPLATIKLDRHGRILERYDTKPQFNPGIGDLTVPLPPEPVQVGAKWSTVEDVRVREERGSVRKIKIKQILTLDKVETGVATLSIDTIVLTPLNDPKLQAQLIQRLQRGTVAFDMDAGRIISKQMDLDETVIGFNGADSQMHYTSRFSEEQFNEAVAAKPKVYGPALR